MKTEEEKNKTENKILPQFKNNMRFITPPVTSRFTKEELEEIIDGSCGVVTIICNQLDCTYKQFYKAIDEYNLRDSLITAKKQLVSLAEKAILDCLNSEIESIKLKAAETTLKSLGKADGWNFDGTTINQQINVSDKTTEIKNIFGIE